MAKEAKNHWLKHEVYDYIFLGTGASASLLLLALERRGLLRNARVLLIDQVKKDKKDKTFCFWSHQEEAINTQLQALISHRWQQLLLPENKVVSIAPLQYNHISSLDLYQKIHELTRSYQWHTLFTPVHHLEADQNGPYLLHDGVKISGTHIFDSRTPVHHPPKTNEIHLLQSFIGWTIRTEVNDPETFRIMDFQIPQHGATQFMYVLPLSSTSALVEVTRFGVDVIDAIVAESILAAYLSKHFGSYEKLGAEQGCIPMSNTKIEHTAVAGVTRLGATNYKIKPSTGYAFKNMYQHAEEVADAIAHGQATFTLNQEHETGHAGRFAFYDGLLLDILKNSPEQGKYIFESLFKKVNTVLILKFLDEGTSLSEEVGLFAKLPWRPFLAALFRKSMRKSWFRPLLLLFTTLLLWFLGNESAVQNMVAYTLLLVGLIVVGIPHGAVDHLIETRQWDKRNAPSFVLKYLLIAVLMGVLWYWFPEMALLLFLLYSAWHFGQADGQRWGLTPLLSFVWGTSVLYSLLGTHLTETYSILASMGAPPLVLPLASWVLLPWLILALFKRESAFIITLIWLLLASRIPLIFAFGIYFIGQHSLNGWFDLQQHLKMSHQKIWRHALPFHMAAWLFMGLFFYFWPKYAVTTEINPWGIFFIFIACISLPHIIAMQTVYRKKQAE